MELDPKELTSLYQLLELEPGASLEDIQLAFRRKAYQLSRDGAEKELTALKATYARLKGQLAATQTHVPTPTPAQPTSPLHTEPEAGAELQILSSGYPQYVEQQVLRDNVDPLSKWLNYHLNHPPYNKKLRFRRLQVEVRLEQAQLQIHLRADLLPAPDVILPLLLQLLGTLELPTLQSLKVYGLKKGSKVSSVIWRREVDLRAQQQEERYDRFSYNNLVINACAFPVASLVAAILNASPLGFFLLPLQIWIHEFGHATVAWLSSRRATPLPIGWTSWSPERSMFVYLGILFLLALLFYSGWRENLRWPMILAGSIALLQFWMTWFLPQDTVEHWITFAGAGGELYLSMGLMICFYFRMPDRWRWDFCRFIVLVIAASSYWKNFWRWHLIKKGQEEIPWGTMLFGEGDAGGDMNRLVDDYGWTDIQIIQTYSNLATVCLLVLLGFYVVNLVKPQVWRNIQQKLVKP